MGTIRKIGKKWYACWTDAQGVRRSKSVSTRKADAQEYLARTEARITRGVVKGYAAVGFTQLCREYLDRVAATVYKPTTYANYERTMRLRLIPWFGDMPVGEITPRDCDAYVASRMRGGAAPGTVRNDVACLGVIMKAGVRWGYAVSSPVPGTSVPKSPRSIATPLSASQARALFGQLPERWVPLFMCAVLTGMRSGELAGLQARDLDFDKHLVSVQRSVWRGKTTTPKTPASVRRIDLTPTLEKTLKEWLASPLRPATSDDLVFPSADGKILNTSNLRESVFYPALSAAGLPRVRMHDLRHTYASLLIANGESLKYVQEMMGHSSIKITADTYGHLLKEAHETAAARLDAAVFGC